MALFRKNFTQYESRRCLGFLISKKIDTFVISLSQFHNSLNSGQKQVVLFPEIGRVKIFLSLSLTRPNSRMCGRTCVFNFKKQTNKNIQKKAKETKEEKKISAKNRVKVSAARMKIFLVTRISGSKRFFLASQKQSPGGVL